MVDNSNHEEINNISLLRDLVGKDKCEHLSDIDVLRFLKARNNNLQKASLMLNEYLTWYVTPIKGVESDTPRTILDQPDPDAEVWGQYFPYSFLGHDKEGCPIYWEKTGECSQTFPEAIKRLSEDKMVWMHILKQEVTLRTRMSVASAFYKTQITKQIGIMDLANVSYAVDFRAMSYCTRSVTIDQNYYPETLKTLYIINAPWFFNMLWAIVRPFLDTVTANKFVILGSDYIDKLREAIDDSQIPVEFGGSRENFVWKSDPHEVDTDDYRSRAVAATV